MAICWEKALAFCLCFLFNAVLIVCAPFPFGVWGRLWNSTVSVPDYCLFIYFVQTKYLMFVIDCDVFSIKMKMG